MKLILAAFPPFVLSHDRRRVTLDSKIQVLYMLLRGPPLVGTKSQLFSKNYINKFLKLRFSKMRIHVFICMLLKCHLITKAAEGDYEGRQEGLPTSSHGLQRNFWPNCVRSSRESEFRKSVCVNISILVHFFLISNFIA